MNSQYQFSYDFKDNLTISVCVEDSEGEFNFYLYGDFWENGSTVSCRSQWTAPEFDFEAVKLGILNSNYPQPNGSVLQVSLMHAGLCAAFSLCADEIKDGFQEVSDFRKEQKLGSCEW